MRFPHTTNYLPKVINQMFVLDDKCCQMLMNHIKRYFQMPILLQLSRSNSIFLKWATKDLLLVGLWLFDKVTLPCLSILSLKAKHKNIGLNLDIYDLKTFFACTIAKGLTHFNPTLHLVHFNFVRISINKCYCRFLKTRCMEPRPISTFHVV